MDKMAIGGQLGHSDHVILDIRIIGDKRKTATKTSTLDMGKADFTLLRMLVGKIPWETLLRALGSAGASHVLITTF